MTDYIKSLIAWLLGYDDVTGDDLANNAESMGERDGYK